MTSKETALTIARILDAKHGENIQVIHVEHLTSVADYFVIASARNANSVRAIAEDVEEKMAEAGTDIRRKEGYGDSRWIVLDYGTVIVHVFHVEEREYYNIERLWVDGTNLVSFENAQTESDTESGDAQ